MFFHAILIFMGLAFFLVGCGGNNHNDKNTDNNQANESEEANAIVLNDEEPEEAEEPKEMTLEDQEIEAFFNEFSTAINDVNIYEVDMEIVAEMSEGENKTVEKAGLFGILDESMTNLDMTVTETAGLNKNEKHIYKLDKDIYIKENDAAWIKTTETNKEFSDTDTSYTNVANALSDVRNVVDVVETEKKYDVTYDGNGNTEIFNAFEKPFSLTLTNIDIETESQMTLQVEIDKTTNFIKDMELEINAEKEGVGFILNVQIDYDNMNDTTVEVPKEVIEEAS